MNLKDPDSMNAVVGNVLRYGVLISGLVIIIGVLRLAGVIAYSDTSNYLAYNPGVVPHGAFDISLQGLIGGLGAFDPVSLIEFGVILLIATPVSRVLISVFLFGAEGDRLYVLVTTIVLILLLFSMLVTPFISLFRA